MIKWCKKCILPNTRPNLNFKDNICTICLNNKVKIIDSKERLNLFNKIIKYAKQNSHAYDCLIPVSGGKDSTAQVIKALELGLKPLTFTWKTPFRTKIGHQNLENLKKLGVDHLDWTINPIIEKKICLDSFRKFGSCAISMHAAIFKLPLKIAKNFKIPLILWGENSAYEYGSEKNKIENFKLNKKWFSKFGVTNKYNFERILKKNNNNINFTTAYDQTLIKENKNIVSIFLGHFFNWDPLNIKKIAEQKGFKKLKKSTVGYYQYADLDDDCLMPIHHWMKWYKFGFTRDFDNLSIEIRKGRISRSKAIKLINKKNFKPPHMAIKKFCKYYEIDTKTFFNIANKFRNKKIWKKNKKNIYEIPNFLMKYNFENENK